MICAWAFAHYQPGAVEEIEQRKHGEPQRAMGRVIRTATRDEYFTHLRECGDFDDIEVQEELHAIHDGVLFYYWVEVD